MYDPAVHTKTAVKATAVSFSQIFATGCVPKIYLYFKLQIGRPPKHAPVEILALMQSFESNNFTVEKTSGVKSMTRAL